MPDANVTVVEYTGDETGDTIREWTIMENCGKCHALSQCMSIAIENGVTRCIHFSEVKKFIDTLSSSVEATKQRRDHGEDCN